MFRAGRAGAQQAATRGARALMAPAGSNIGRRAADISSTAPVALFLTRPNRALTGTQHVQHGRGFSSTPRTLLSDSGAGHDGSVAPHIVSKSSEDVKIVSAALEKLLRATGRWTLTSNGLAIERSFRFKNFTKTWDFMTAVALQCKLKNHHPEWSNVYNTTFVRWTTHSPSLGLTRKDVELAALCDELGRAFGEVVEEKTTTEAPNAGAADTTTAPSGLQGLADAAAAMDCDCSEPRPSKKG